MGGGIKGVTRGLPIDAALVGDVLTQLRRDTLGPATAWTLGGRGSADLDVEFYPVLDDETTPDTALPAWTTTARLWDADGLAVVYSVLELTAVSSDACELSIRPELPLTPWWSARTSALLDLAQATLDELAEELLWHATREHAT